MAEFCMTQSVRREALLYTTLVLQRFAEGKTQRIAATSSETSKAHASGIFKSALRGMVFDFDTTFRPQVHFGLKMPASCNDG